MVADVSALALTSRVAADGGTAILTHAGGSRYQLEKGVTRVDEVTHNSLTGLNNIYFIYNYTLTTEQLGSAILLRKQ